MNHAFGPIIVAILASLALAPSYAAAETDAAAAEPVEALAVVVDGTPVTCSEVVDEARQLAAALGPKAGRLNAERLFERALEARITELVQIEEAKRLELTVSDEELGEAIANIERSNGLLPGQLEEALKAQGIDVADYRARLRNQLLIGKLINTAVRGRIRISEEALREYYRRYLSGNRKLREVHLAHIFLQLPADPSPEQLAEARSRARSIRARLSAGEDFASLARIHSQAPDATEGGDMGWVTEGSLPERLAQVFELPVGGISEPILTPAGFQIFKVIEERWLEPERGESYDEVHARHILLKIPSSADERTRARIRLKAERLAAELKDASDEEFATRAKEVSQGPSAARGGDLGWFRRGTMVPAFEEAAFRLKPGQTSGVVESPFGLHIIRVVARRHVDPNSFEAHRDRIEQVLTDAEMQERIPRWIASLKARATIERHACPKPMLASILTPARPNATPQAEGAGAAAAASESPETAVARWQAAWESRDPERYFARYSARFDPGPRFASVERWKRYKRRVLTNKAFIRIELRDLEFRKLDDGRIEARFTQLYQSDRLSSTDRKRLVLVRENGRWLIEREEVLR